MASINQILKLILTHSIQCLLHANVPKKKPHDMAFDFTKKFNKEKRRNISMLAQI